MYVRSKVSKGRTYYQVVQGERIGSQVKQRVVVSLGTIKDPASALVAMRRHLAELEGEMALVRKHDPGDTSPTRSCRLLNLSLERLGCRISTLSDRIKKLEAVLDGNLIESPQGARWSARRTAVHEAGHAVFAFANRLSVRRVVLRRGLVIDCDGNVVDSRGYVESDLSFIQPRSASDTEEGCLRLWEMLQCPLGFLCAGHAAEGIDAHKSPEAIEISGADHDSIIDWLEPLGLNEAGTNYWIRQAVNHAVAILEFPVFWCQVVALAQRLLKDRTLTGRQAKMVCTRARREYLERGR